MYILNTLPVYLFACYCTSLFQEEIMKSFLCFHSPFRFRVAEERFLLLENFHDRFYRATFTFEIKGSSLICSTLKGTLKTFHRNDVEM